MSTDRYRRTPAMMHSIDQAGRLADVSDVWLQKMGYTRDEVVGRPSTDFLTQASQTYASEVVLPEFFKTGSCVASYDLVRKDGSVLPVRLHATATRGDDGTFLHSNAFLEDLTEKRELEGRMQQAQKLESLGLLAGGVAHDFNNLLMAILGNTELALRKMDKGSEAGHFLVDAISAAQQASDLCRQLLAFSGRGRFSIQEVDVSLVVREMLQVLDVTVGRNAVVKLDLEVPGPMAEVDVTQLRQIVMNLVINAAEALGGARGLITVSTSVRALGRAYLLESVLPETPPGNFVCIEVADTGPGVERDTIGRMFDPFFSTKGPGRGLGLAAIQGILKSHGGTIRVYSEPGRGTSFKVFLPTKDTVAVSSDERRLTKSRGAVLVLDDEPSVRATVSRMLTHSGYEALEASNAEEALLYVRARGREIHCFLLDVTMPDMSGPELFGKIRDLLPEARVVLMSGYNHSDIVRRYTVLGLAGFLQKPFALDALLATIEGAGSSS